MPTIVMGKSSKPEQSKSFTPTAAGSVITPDTGYTLSQVTVNGDADLVSANIKSGVNIFGVAGNSNVVDTSAGDATAAQILSGKKAYVDGALVTGTIPSKAAATYTPGTSNQTISAGQYLSGAQTISGDADLVTGNIKSGANIFGVAGKASVVDTSDANAVAGNMLSGKTAYVNGSKITGTIASKGAQTYTPGTSNQTIAAGQYLSGAQTIAGDADLVAGNIKSGVNIFGVLGTLGTGVKTIQFGTSPLESGIVYITLATAVESDNSIVILKPCMVYGSSRTLYNFTDTTLTLYTGVECQYIVIEFSPGVIKSIQRGREPGTTSIKTVNHSSVDVNKSFVLLDNSIYYGAENSVNLAKIISRTATSFTYRGNYYEYGSGAVSYQIVEFY